MSQVVRQKIANKIYELRLQSKLSREELSLRLGLDNSYISKLERCKINISIDRLEDIANFFNIKIVEFFQ